MNSDGHYLSAEEAEIRWKIFWEKKSKSLYHSPAREIVTIILPDGHKIRMTTKEFRNWKWSQQM